MGRPAAAAACGGWRVFGAWGLVYGEGAVLGLVCGEGVRLLCPEFVRPLFFNCWLFICWVLLCRLVSVATPFVTWSPHDGCTLTG